MPSMYLNSSELSNYGLPPTTTPAQIQQASALIDGYLKRPEGLVYVPDWTGVVPCYMAAATPQYTFTSAGSIAPGTNVNVPLSVNVPAQNNSIGDVVILDRGNSSVVEACVISAVTPGVLQLATVVNSHGTACTMETGLVLTENRSLASKRSIMHVSRPPLVILSGLGRYAYGRRTDQAAGMYNEINLLAAIQAFGGPPMWVPFDVALAACEPTTHEVWIPAGLLLAYFSEVKLRYVTGFPQANLPFIVKQATAMVVEAFRHQPDLTGNIKQFKAADTLIMRFENTILDGDTKRQLSEYRAKLMI